jgi:hypothetical protein
MLTKIYMGLAGMALGFYLFTTFAGREFGSTKLSSAPPSSGSSSGGRSGGFFWGGGGSGGGK